MLSSICASLRCILAWVKFRSRVLTALNLLPSIATLASLNSSRPSTQHHELTADLADGLTIVFPEVGYRLEVWHQAAGQPNQFDVALAFPFQAPARLHPIEGIRRRKSSTTSPDDRPAFLSSPAQRRQSRA